MAPRLVPEHPKFETATEREVWEVLRTTLAPDDVLMANLRLSDEVKDHEADIVAIIGGAGVVVIEVKGGSVGVVDGVKRARVVARLPPPTVDHPDAAALDLDDHDSSPADDRDDVSFMVLHLITEPKVGHQHVIRRERCPEDLPDLALGSSLELGVLGDQTRSHQLARGSARTLSPPCTTTGIAPMSDAVPSTCQPARYQPAWSAICASSSRPIAECPTAV